jgi:hypothetical protein
VTRPEPEPGGFDPSWLALREPADRAARAESLVEPLLAALRPGTTLQVHDLGSGTGSMPRWLAPRLPGPQLWVLHDHDPALLAAAARGCAGLRDSDGHPVRIETRTTDLSRLRPADLAGAGLVTASALLDLLTAAELEALAGACAVAGCPALLTLSVAGHVELDPPDPRDVTVAAAFNAHQRRTVSGRRLLGPDAPAAAAAAFARHGMDVRTAASPWRLGPDRAELIEQWLSGWVAAAAEQQPDLRREAAGYLGDRLRRPIGLTVRVQHRDLLARPVGTEPG